MSDVTVGQAPRRGRPPGSARSAIREPIHQPSRNAVVYGRDGQPLTRSRTAGTDKFHIDPKLIPEGWSYQWNTVRVVGSTEAALAHSNEMYRQGWRPVPADRHDGLFMRAGATGEIVIDGMRLEERPEALTFEAKEENERAARQLVRDRDAALMGGKANIRQAVEAAGFEMGGKYKGAGGDIRMSIDAALDAPKPSHQLAEPGE